MFNKVSVLIPTRGRVPWLKELFASFDETVGEDDAELVFRIDSDDLETRDFLLDRGNCVVAIGPRLEGYRSLPVFFNEMLPAAHGDVLMCGNDDMIFRTIDWPAMILDTANMYPDGLFDIGVQTHNETHFPFSIISKRVAEMLGFIWDPRIFWGDIFLRDVMGAFGRTVMLPTVHIEHKWAGYRPDKVFKESDKDIIGRDPWYWTTTHRQAVDDAVYKLSGVKA